jgi:solute carrier family 25 aspartate/glutamate transporter 12/13
VEEQPTMAKPSPATAQPNPPQVVVVPELPLRTIIFKNLIMGGMAGIIGATSVYPLDLAKTKVQFQKSGANQLYSGPLDCLRKIFASEGFAGLYRGLPAQLVGIAPEKAIKLTVNDVIRYKFTDKKTGRISILAEVFAGCCAGFSQVVATGPYELVKVRLQTDPAKRGAFAILKELGFRGLFTGAGATLLRDVPFSAIYFTTYGNMKRLLTDEHGHLGGPQFLIAGLASGVVSAFLATPADVIKTRLQAKSEDGKKYNGIRDCFFRTLKEEGHRAFFKGAIPRILIISPLFGITLCTYELMKGFFLPPGANKV